MTTLHYSQEGESCFIIMMNEEYQNEIDPDINFFEDTRDNMNDNCSYYQIDDFKNKHALKSDDQFSIIHLNIRSMSKHFDELQLLTDTLKCDFTCMGLTETWNTQSNHDTFEIEGYVHYQVFRSMRVGGGVSLYLNENLQSHERQDLCAK